MYLLLAIVAAVIGAYASPRNLAEVPLSQLTPALLRDNAFSAAGYLAIIVFGYRSLRSDRIWPWRWTLRYVGNLLIRSAVFTFVVVVVGAYLLFDDSYWTGWRFVSLVAFAAIFTMYTLFSTDLDVFQEPDKPQPAAAPKKGPEPPGSVASD